MMIPRTIALLSITGCLFLSGCGGGEESTTTETTTTDTTTDDGDSGNTITPSLVINEIVAAASDDGNDWIELYATEDGVNLADYSLTDDKDDRVAQVLPEATLNQGDFVVIQAIDEEDTPPSDGYYVTFKLGNDDAVILYQNGTEVDQLDWEEGDALEGSSYGLYTDGTGSAQTLLPTPSAANELASGSEVVVTDLIINEKPSLRVNEVVAQDSSGGADWIELYASGDDAVNLSDYKISDENNELMSLPDVTLSAGEFYRLYATTDDIADETTVAFKLGGGDTVNLYMGDDLVDQLEWKKGQALIGYSYGRYPDGSDGTQILVPSAEGTNQLASHASLVISEVMANDPNEGADWFELYNNGDSNIELSQYQIIDESDDIDPVSLPNITLAPGQYSVFYAVETASNDNEVSFKLGNSDELSLLLNDETVDYIDWDGSDVISGFSYGLSEIDGVARSWQRDLLTPTQGSENQLASAFNPDAVVDLSISITTADWQDILANPTDEEYHEASLTLNGISLDTVAIRTKGGSSLRSVSQSTSDRYSFKVDINEYVDGQKFFGLKKFTLQNSFNDPTYMREVIAYDLLEEMGVAAPRHSYVNLHINGELFGLYLMVEAIDGEFLENHFDNANGDMYKPDGTGSDLKWIDNNIASYSDINLQTNEDTTDNGAFMNFVEQLDQGSTDVIAVDNLLRYMSVSVSLSNLDSYHGTLAHNYYIYEQDGVFDLLPWDFNESFGTFTMGCSNDIRELYIDEPVSEALSDRPMVGNVFNDDNNLAIYHDYLWQLIDGPLTDEAFSARVNNIADLIREHVENDPTRFYTASQFELNLTSTVGQFYGLTGFMSYRVNNMIQQLNGDIASSGTGNGYCN